MLNQVGTTCLFRDDDAGVHITNRNGSDQTVVEGINSIHLNQSSTRSPEAAVKDERTGIEEDSIGRMQLSEQVWKDLTFAESVGYTVRVLNKQISDSQWQVIVLFGERHSSNTDIELKAAGEVIKHFSSFGQEGWQPTKFVGGETCSSEIQSGRQQYCELKGLHNKGAIDLATERHKKISDLADTIIHELVKQTSSEKSITQSAPVVVTPEGLGVSRELFEEAVKIIQDILASQLVTPEGARQLNVGTSIHHLEDKHRPDWLEHFHYINEAFGHYFARFMTDDARFANELSNTC